MFYSRQIDKMSPNSLKTRDVIRSLVLLETDQNKVSADDNNKEKYPFWEIVGRDGLALFACKYFVSF